MPGPIGPIPGPPDSQYWLNYGEGVDVNNAWDMLTAVITSTVPKHLASLDALSTRGL